MKKQSFIPVCVREFCKKITVINILIIFLELGAIFFLVQSILTVFPSGKSNWYLPMALGLNCIALGLNLVQQRKK